MDFWHNHQAQRRLFLRFLLLVTALLLPVFVLAYFARPSADDYIYAAETHAVLTRYGLDWPRLLAAAWEANAYFFENWQGLYVSAFVLALQPGVFGGGWYGLTILCVLVPLFFCLYGACHILIKLLEPGQRLLPWAMALLLLFGYVENLPSPVEGLYWFNGAMNYIPFFAAAVLNAALATKLCTAKTLPMHQKTVSMLAGVLLSIFIGGGHQVVGVLNLLVLGLIAVLCLRRKNAWTGPAFVAGAAGLLINLTAPGTRVRAGGFAGAGLGEAAVKSFLLSALAWLRWLDVPLLCLLALLALPLYRLAGSERLSDSFFRAPLAGPASTFVLMWAMIFLPSYTMGGIGAGRLLNVVWMTFVLGLAASLFLLFGWMERVRKVSFAGAKAFVRRNAKGLSVAGAVLMVLMACIGSRTVKEGYDNHFATSLEAAYELANGEASAFAKALDEREDTLADPAEQDVEIRPLAGDERPYLLFFTDVAPGPDLWGLTPYYEKESVTVVAPET